MKILIIGYGVVGKNMHKVFPEADICDPEQGRKPMTKNYDLGFVCVPTPMLKDGSCDTSIVKDAIAENMARVKVFCIRSTIPPGTTTEIKTVLDFHKVTFMPEYFGETIHANGHDYDFIIIGGHRQDTAVVAEAYTQVKHSRLKIYQTDTATAELTKYMENCWLATKVTFCNEFYRIAEKIGVDYNELRELWLADPRIDRSHTWVFEDQPYYDSKCLNKDIPALIRFAEKEKYSPGLMIAVETTNERHKAR